MRACDRYAKIPGCHTSSAHDRACVYVKHAARKIIAHVAQREYRHALSKLEQPLYDAQGAKRGYVDVFVEAWPTARAPYVSASWVTSENARDLYAAFRAELRSNWNWQRDDVGDPPTDAEIDAVCPPFDRWYAIQTERDARDRQRCLDAELQTRATPDVFWIEVPSLDESLGDILRKFEHYRAMSWQRFSEPECIDRFDVIATTHALSATTRVELNHRQIKIVYLDPQKISAALDMIEKMAVTTLLASSQ